MPITIKPSRHEANIITLNEAGGWKAAEDTFDALPNSCKAECKEILQCGIDFDNSEDICKSSNGFVFAAIEAYTNHHHLNIRPEDVWFAILTQMSAYINAHAEELRGKFVSHEGKKELVLTYDNTSRYTFDFSRFTKDMADLLQQNVVDPDLRDWIMPTFSTTAAQDTILASIVMMASLQAYFSYTCSMGCGLPSVTLLGEKADWEKVLGKLEKLKTFGKEPKKFYNVLKPVIIRFISSFEEPKSRANIDFWQRIASLNAQGSHEPFYTGWLTAFCFWDDKGRCLHRPEKNPLKLDGVAYASIKQRQIPSGWVKVPVRLNDNGVELESVMVAGSTGIGCTSSGRELSNGLVDLDTMSARACWWIYEKK